MPIKVWGCAKIFPKTAYLCFFFQLHMCSRGRIQDRRHPLRRFESNFDLIASAITQVVSRFVSDVGISRKIFNNEKF